MSDIRDNKLINALLWPFAHLPNDYVVLDTETTGIFDEEGAPGIISIGIVRVKNRIIDSTTEFKIKPHRPVLDGAFKIHGISNDIAQCHPEFNAKWETIRKQLDGQLVIIHNASFDWPLLVDHIHRYKVEPPLISGIFCSQRSAQPWASTMGLKCSERGPSLDTLTEALGIENLRAQHDGLHGAGIDAKQTARVVNALRHKAKGEQPSPETSGLSVSAANTYALAEAVFGNKEKATHWLHAPLKIFNNQSAIEMMKTEDGARRVEEYLTQLDAGHFT